jgi:phosphatidate cytidylyltransferase
MKRVATAVVLIPVVLVLTLRAPSPIFVAAVAAVALLGVRELLDMAVNYGVRPLRRPTFVYVIVLFAALLLSLLWQTQVADLGVSTMTLLALAGFAFFVFLVAAMRCPELPQAYPAAATSLVAVLYIALPLGLLAVVRELWAGGFLLFYLFAVVWAGDTFAYYAGRAFGRHRLSPRISPGKTWEGTTASFVGSIVIGWLIFAHAYQISAALMSIGVLAPRYAYTARLAPPATTIILLSAAINIAGQLGDLAESLIKRGAGVKDSGAALPGHGGVLDRIDALLFAAPVLWYYAGLRILAQGHL